MNEFRRKFFFLLGLMTLAVLVSSGIYYYKFLLADQFGRSAERSHLIQNNISRLGDIVAEIQFLRSHADDGQRAFSRVDVSVQLREATILIDETNGILASVQERRQVASIRQKFQRFSSIAADRSIGKVEVSQARGEIRRALDALSLAEERIFNSQLKGLIEANHDFYLIAFIGTLCVFVFIIYVSYYTFLSRARGASIQQKFEELRDKQAQSLQATRDGIFEWRLPQQDMFWSPRGKELIGYTEHEIDASPEKLEELMHPEDRAAFWQHLHEHLNGSIEEFSAFFRLRHKQGFWVWINARGRAVFNEFSEPVKLLGVFTDVTKLKEYELQLARSKSEAEKANNAKSDFMAHMSHEIRTPLTAITGVSEILSIQKANFDEKTQKLISALNSSAIGLRDLISDILDYSRIEAGRLSLEQRPFRLDHFFEDLIEDIFTKARAKNTDFLFRLPGLDHVEVTGDEMRLRQILVNILGNAVKFTEGGRIEMIAERIFANGQAMLKVTVSDTGIGIADDQLPHIFDSFRQGDTSASRRYGGTGLGLPIAQRLAHMMSGNIHAASRKGEGSHFTVLLALQFSSADDGTTVEPAGQPAMLNMCDQDKILIVEDYEGNIIFITHILDELGVRYDLARNGVEGLILFKQRRYKLILMDIQMPEMDGITAVKEIRLIEDKEDLSPVPVIAMTAHAFSEDREKCISAGFDEYLPKPLSRNALHEALVRLIPKSEA